MIEFQEEKEKIMVYDKVLDSYDLIGDICDIGKGYGYFFFINTPRYHGLSAKDLIKIANKVNELNGEL